MSDQAAGTFQCWACGGTEFDWSVPKSRYVLLGVWAAASKKKLRCRRCNNISDPPAGVTQRPPVVIQQPGAWHPDPYGQHRLRWWDGQRWTSEVAD